MKIPILPLVLPSIPCWGRAVLLLSALVFQGCATDDGDQSFHFTSRPVTSAAVGVLWEYRITLKNGWDVLSLTAEGPPGMTLSGRVLTWLPSRDDLGTHEVRLSAFGMEGVLGPSEDAHQRFELRVHQDLEMGTGFSPRGHSLGSTPLDDREQFEDRGHGRVLAFNGPWRDSLAQAGEIPAHARQGLEAAREFRFVPAIGLRWADAAGNPDLASDTSSENSRANAETRAAFLDMVTDLALRYRPPYLFLGDETNVYYASHTRQEWEDWLSEFVQCAEAVHTLSPGTLVFTTFQFERLQGLGANAGWSGPAQWELLDELAALGVADAAGFTSFPHLEYDRLAAMPPEYWRRIVGHWSGRVVFAAVAWPASPHAPYPGDEVDQAEMIVRFLAEISSLDVEYAAWLFLHDWDQEDTMPELAATGLRDNPGLVQRMADAIWQASTSLRQR